MDGIQFINQFIKLFEKTAIKSKLVVLTSSINPEDKKVVSKLSREILFLNKPLTNESLALIA